MDGNSLCPATRLVAGLLFVHCPVYRTVYSHALFAQPCTNKGLNLFGDVGLQTGFHAVDRGSNPLGDAN